ncbi:MAG TPA: hypothetical protein VF043_33630 [Ktedonobacteraceae bacterium]
MIASWGGVIVRHVGPTPGRDESGPLQNVSGGEGDHKGLCPAGDHKGPRPYGMKQFIR